MIKQPQPLARLLVTALWMRIRTNSWHFAGKWASNRERENEKENNGDDDHHHHDAELANAHTVIAEMAKKHVICIS